jgi:hypothetical protein
MVTSNHVYVVCCYVTITSVVQVSLLLLLLLLPLLSPRREDQQKGLSGRYVPAFNMLKDLQAPSHHALHSNRNLLISRLYVLICG